MKIADARFLKSAVGPESWPPEGPVEIAFAGRSNVGKSSLINRLVGRKALARTSQTPGRTRSLNFIDVDLAGAVPSLRLCDLPGYGYAKVAKHERERWGPMVEAYVLERGTLALVVVIVDARHDPTELDARMVAWLAEVGRPFLVAATKLDKLKKAKKKPALARLEAALGVPVLGVSAHSGEGKDTLWRRILEHVAK